MLWWYPYGRDFQALMATAGRALHGRSLLSRLSNQLALASKPRFWRRINLFSLLRNLDKLF
jgi:hypothetical protein